MKALCSPLKSALLCLLAVSPLISCSKKDTLQRQAAVVRAELDLKRAEMKDLDVQLRALTTTALPKPTRKPPTQEEVDKAKAEVKKLQEEKEQIEGVVKRLQKTLDDSKNTLAIAMEPSLPGDDPGDGATPVAANPTTPPQQ